MRKYIDIKHILANRYIRKIKWAKEYLGNKCVRCGATTGLEFDHIDPTLKEFNISKIWGAKFNQRVKQMSTSL